MLHYIFSVEPGKFYHRAFEECFDFVGVTEKDVYSDGSFLLHQIKRITLD